MLPEAASTDVSDATAAGRGAFALRHIHIFEDRAWAGLADVVVDADVREYARQLALHRKATEGAEAVLARARSDAEGIVKRAHQQARTLGDTQLKLWQEAFDVRQEELSNSLGQAVAVVVESVLGTLLGSSDDLPVKVSIELAMRVLNAELRSSVLCHPLDLPLVKEKTGRLGSKAFSADDSLARGQIVFTGAEGDVRVDGQRVIDRLMSDLREVLSAKGVAATAAKPGLNR